MILRIRTERDLRLAQIASKFFEGDYGNRIIGHMKKIGAIDRVPEYHESFEVVSRYNFVN